MMMIMIMMIRMMMMMIKMMMMMIMMMFFLTFFCRILIFEAPIVLSGGFKLPFHVFRVWEKKACLQ